MPGSRRFRYRSRAGVGNAFLRVSVQQGKQFKNLSQQLNEAGRGDLRKQLNKNIRATGKPVVRDVQNAARNVRVSSTKKGHAKPDRSTGLRKRVAAATGVSVTQRGITIRVSAKKFGEYGYTLPKYLDATLRTSKNNYKRWRHPVFGNREVWAEQKGSPYFGVTIKKHSRDFRSAIQKAMDDVADDITE